MKKLNQIRINYCFVTLLMTGCGYYPALEDPAIKSADSASPETDLIATKVSPSKRLGLKIMTDSPNDNDPSNPDSRESTENLMEDAALEGNKIILHRKLFLKDVHSLDLEHHRELFFVWSEESFDSLIKTVQYNHRIMDVDGKWKGNLRTRQAWHDTAGRRWFIPISDLFKKSTSYNESDASLEDTQVLNLELVLAEGANVVIEIRFQVVGPLPSVSVEELTLSQPDLQDLLHGAGASGWLIREEQFTNPNSRPFLLWVKSSAEKQSLELTTYLKSSEYQPRSDAEPEGPLWTFYSSKAALKVGFLEIVHGDRQAERVDLAQKKTDWAQISLLPSEKITLRWWAKPAANTLNCFLPSSQVIHFNWYVPAPATYSQWESIGGMMAYGQARFQVARFPDPPGPQILKSRLVRIDHFLAGAQLTGKWSREVRVTHPFSKDVATAESLALVKATIDQKRIAGEIPTTVPLYGSCQGVFGKAR